MTAAAAARPERSEPVLDVRGLSVSIRQADGRWVRIVEDVDLRIARGETVGLVGESGCGKSVTALTLMRLLPMPPARVDSGRAMLQGVNLLALPERRMRELRGNRIAMVFQEPMTSLNPTFTVGWQIEEAIRLHRPGSVPELRRRALELLDHVGIGAAARRLNQYPHELSGGLRQRVMIAMAIACEPDLLIADEPTTALDVTIQAQVLDLLARLQQELGMGILMITHDLGVVAEFCDRVSVMYAGRVVERADSTELFGRPRHPYTGGLMASLPRIGQKRGRLAVIPGIVPQPGERPAGCAFQGRCAYATDRCRVEEPPLADPDRRDHDFACFNPLAQ